MKKLKKTKFNSMSMWRESANQNSMDMELLFAMTICVLALINGFYNAVNTIVKTFFTYNSWHIPFFFAIGGIFFARNTLKKKFLPFLLKKCRTLLVPALFVNLCYGLISNLMRSYGLVNFGKVISFDSLFLAPFMENYQFQNDLCLWLLFQLFVIEIIMKAIYRIPGLRKMKYFDLSVLIFTLIISFVCITLSKTGTKYALGTLFLGRTGFLLFFFTFGIFYERHLKQFLEKKDMAIRGCYIALILQTIVMYFSNWTSNYDVRTMGTSNLSNTFLPFFNFLTAFTFLICLSRLLSPLLKESRMLGFIGNDLHYVIYHFQFFGMLISLYALLLCGAGKAELLNKFEPTDFLKNRWYAATFVGNGFGKIPYLILPFFGPLLTAKLINKLPHRLMRFLGWCIALVLSLIVIMIVGISLREYLGTL